MTYEILVNGFTGPDFVLNTNRVLLGLFFLSAGYHKLAVGEVKERFAGLVSRLGLPPVMRIVIPSGEALGGLGLIVGALSIPAALGLSLIILGAWCMTCLPTIKQGHPRDVLDWISKSMMQPETLIFVMLGYVIKAGPGSISVDAYAVQLLKQWGL